MTKQANIRSGAMFAAVVLALLAGCAGEPEPTEDPKPEPTPTTTEVVTPEPEPTEDPKPEPTPTTTEVVTPEPEDEPESSNEPEVSSEDESQDAHWLDNVLGYPDFDEVDPYTSGFFIALEDEGSDPVTYLGGLGSEREAFLWNQGVMFCDDLDDGNNGNDFTAALEALAERSGLGDRSGVLAGAAVTGICDDHRVAAMIWAESNA